MAANHLFMKSPAEAIESGHPLPDYAEITYARTRFSALLDELPPALAEIGCRLLDRISTANWSMEWCLPIWLACDLALDRNARQLLVLSNALGLAYTRLMDDLVDGDVERGAEGVVAMLANVLYHHVIRRYIGLLGDDTRFWDRFEGLMSRWRQATVSRTGPGTADSRPLQESHLLALAERGAPLKVGCVAACLLSQREEAMPALLSALDHWLVVVVLLDHARDWADDLAAGRFNALVAHVDHRPRNSSGETRFAVAEAILLGDAMGTYHDVIRRHLGRAAQMARAAGCSTLSQQMEALGDQALVHSERLENQARARLRAATQQLLSTSPMPARQPIDREGGEPDGS